MDVICPYCGKPAKLVTGKEIYSHRLDLYSLKFWQCAPCDAYVGCHRSHHGTTPLGRLANAELRAAKSAAHRAFDPIWKYRYMNRSNAYSWLANKLSIPAKDCHIGMFDVADCEKVVKVAQEYMVVKELDLL